MSKIFAGGNARKIQNFSDFLIFSNFVNFPKFCMDENFQISVHPNYFWMPHGPPKPRFIFLRLLLKILRELFGATEIFGALRKRALAFLCPALKIFGSPILAVLIQRGTSS